jgi:hypothetical protein
MTKMANDNKLGFRHLHKTQSEPATAPHPIPKAVPKFSGGNSIPG